jgi:hypothetical protein
MGYTISEDDYIIHTLAGTWSIMNKKRASMLFSTLLECSKISELAVRRKNLTAQKWYHPICGFVTSLCVVQR